MSDPCVITKAPVGNHGYGVLTIGGKKMLTHRLAYLLAHGSLPAGGLVVRHLCGNPLCVNPRHLAEGTKRQNTADAIEHGTFPSGEAHHSTKLTDADVIAIRQSSETGKAIAARYGITPASVSNIRLGKTWKHLL